MLYFEKEFRNGEKVVSATPATLEELTIAQKKRNRVHKEKNLKREYLISRILKEDENGVFVLDKAATKKFVEETVPEVDKFEIG